MKRKQDKSLFFWREPNKGVDHILKRVKRDDCDPDESEEIIIENPQIELILKPSPSYSDTIRPLPYEMLMKIFDYVIESSNHPLRDLCSLSKVCESWRQIILNSPRLWYRIDLTQLPTTDRNVATLARLFKTIPNFIDHVKEVSLRGPFQGKTNKISSVLDNILAAPNIELVSLTGMNKLSNQLGTITKSISRCKKLRHLIITQSKSINHNHKWLTDHLTNEGHHLEVLNLAMSLSTVSASLLKSVGSDFCPRLRVLDVSTFDALNTHSFDATLLAKSMPQLEVLRLANLSFKRINEPPQHYGLSKLRELSMPVAMRDLDRDDALFATLAYGSDSITSLDIRGSTISMHALMNMPSYQVRELHIDDLCPSQQSMYHQVIKKWSRTLEQLSLVKITSNNVLAQCLANLYEESGSSPIKELDLSSSDVEGKDLVSLLQAAKNLNSINLSSCRSLPRGCKGQYSKKPVDRSTQRLNVLFKKLVSR